MIDQLIEPFAYGYMFNAMWVSAMVGAVCAFISCYLMLKGWSLIGDALSHSVVPGVAGAYMLGLPFALGAFLAGGLAAGAMLFLSGRSGLKIDVIIGIIFTSFFGLGLFMVSLSPMSVSIQTIIMGNILAITPQDIVQLSIIGAICLTVLLLKWKDLMVTFFDENHARSIGLKPDLLKAVFFMLLSAAVVAAMMTVGAFLVMFGHYLDPDILIGEPVHQRTDIWCIKGRGEKRLTVEAGRKITGNPVCQRLGRKQ